MRYSAETVAPAAEVIRRAREAFGPSGAGLRLATVGLLGVEFRGAVAFVTVTIEPGDGRNTVVVETRELDAEARRFLAQLPRRRSPRQWLRRRRARRS